MNDVEGWHNRLNMKARTANLNFYVLVQLLKGEANMVPLQSQLLKEDKIKKWQRKQTAATQGKLWKFKFKFKFIIWYIALRHPSDVASVLARTAYGEVKRSTPLGDLKHKR